MKKLFVYGLSIALVAGAASCKKSSKGKMANEWTISSYESTITSTTTNTGSPADTDVQSISSDGATLTITSSSNGTANDPVTGTVNAFTYTIEKDGTWSSLMDITTTQTIDIGGTVYTATTNSKEESTGTFDFLNGVSKDFKKNERVVFNTLTSKTTTVSSSDIPGSSSSTDVDDYTYAEGENSMIYVITESKKKSLILTSAENNTYTTDGYNSTDVGSTTMTLTAE